jgi:hypothetical protein
MQYLGKQSLTNSPAWTGKIYVALIEKSVPEQG